MYVYIVNSINNTLSGVIYQAKCIYFIFELMYWIVYIR